MSGILLAQEVLITVTTFLLNLTSVAELWHCQDCGAILGSQVCAAPDRCVYLVGTFPVQFLLVLVPLHELLHEGDCHFAVLKLGPAVLILDGWCVMGE